MKKNFSLPRIILYISIIIVTSLFGCENVNDWSTDESYSRLFSPATFEAADIESSSVTFRFSQTANTDLYLIEISKDSLVFGNIMKEISIPTSEAVLDTTDVNKIYIYTADKLTPSTLYSARIRTRSNSGIPDSRWVSLTFTTGK